MHAIVIHSNIIPREVPVPARVPVGPPQHHLSDIHQPELEPSRSTLPLRAPELLHLRHVHLQIDPLEPCLVAPDRPRAHAVPALVPLAVLEMRRCVSPQKCRAFVARQTEQGLKCCPEGHSVAVVHG